MNPTSFKSTQTTITILGCGYVGVTTAVVLANCGFNVYAIEPNKKRAAVLKTGKSFFYEAGVDQLLQQAMKDKTLIIADSYEQAVPNSSIIFSCVGTPDNPDGSSNLTYIFASAESTAKVMHKDAIFVQKSTVPVGTGEKLEAVFKAAGIDVRYVSNPEFLSESTAIRDTLWFDRIVAGSSDVEAIQKIHELYKHIEERRLEIGALAEVERPKTYTKPSYIETTRNSAELIKVSANAFLSLKISFANSIAKLADQAGADITEIMEGVGADKRIGPMFLNAGRGYGGGCFPKDVSGLIKTAKDYDATMEIMEAAVTVNNSMPGYIIKKAEHALGSSLNDKKVAILGLAFKAGTSDVRRSPAITIANSLIEQGAHVKAYDPKANDEAKEILQKGIVVCKNIAEAIADAACIFIATDWPEFIDVSYLQDLKNEHVIVVDCMNRIDKVALPAQAIYVGIGR